ncbi:MAG: sugar transferase [Pseudomonadota bacterium]
MRLSELNDGNPASGVQAPDRTRMIMAAKAAAGRSWTDPHHVQMRARASKARAAYRCASPVAQSMDRVSIAQVSQDGVQEVAQIDFNFDVPQFRPTQLALKRAFDIVAASIGIVLLLPLLVLIALLIKTGSKGPVLFRQDRTGLNNKPFTIFKFRSMYTDRCDISGVTQTRRDDARITPIGRVLRRTNLDELPQLFNVLKGEMSLIGPRPHVPGMYAAGMLYEDLIDDYAHRHHMRPGITGLAQCNGLRGPTTEPEPAALRIVHDLEYVQSFSLWLDMKILFKTMVNEIFSGKGF